MSAFRAGGHPGLPWGVYGGMRQRRPGGARVWGFRVFYGRTPAHARRKRAEYEHGLVVARAGTRAQVRPQVRAPEQGLGP